MGALSRLAGGDASEYLIGSDSGVKFLAREPSCPVVRFAALTDACFEVLADHEAAVADLDRPSVELEPDAAEAAAPGGTALVDRQADLGGFVGEGQPQGAQAVVAEVLLIAGAMSPVPSLCWRRSGFRVIG
ncbi:hypothetical protein QA861_25800 [Streptomyces sp. B21-083]